MSPSKDATDDARQEAKLVAAVAAKNEAAFERLYKRYYHRLLKFVGGMVKDNRMTEEIVDDAMFAVWRGAANFKGESKVSTWIFGIGYRRALKALAREKRHRHLENDEAILDLTVDEDQAARPESVATAADLQRHIGRGIEQLSDDHRAVVLLMVMGYGYDQIAEVVGSPATTVKTRMFYARKNLKQFLAATPELRNTDMRQPQSWPHTTRIS